MDLLLPLTALLVGAVALVLNVRLRGDYRHARNLAADALRDAAIAKRQAETAEAKAELAESMLQQVRRELVALRAAQEAPPPPPLPRAARGRLDDLREQLRAAHLEPDEGDS
jgi:hypothetical protein